MLSYLVSLKNLLSKGRAGMLRNEGNRIFSHAFERFIAISSSQTEHQTDTFH